MRFNHILLHKKQYRTLLTAAHEPAKSNSRAVNARLCNFQYARTGATELLPSWDVYCPALERA